MIAADQPLCILGFTRSATSVTLNVKPTEWYFSILKKIHCAYTSNNFTDNLCISILYVKMIATSSRSFDIFIITFFWLGQSLWNSSSIRPDKVTLRPSVLQSLIAEHHPLISMKILCHCGPTPSRKGGDNDDSVCFPAGQKIIRDRHVILYVFVETRSYGEVFWVEINNLCNQIVIRVWLNS